MRISALFPELNKKISACNKCKISQTRGFGYGYPNAEIMMIAQSPGIPKKPEDILIPFALNKREGENSGTLLINLMRDVGIPREKIYITNIIKCSKADPPTDVESFNCSEFLRQELVKVYPRWIVLFGSVAKKQFYAFEQQKAFDYTPFVMTAWHPAYVLRDVSKYEKWVEDFKKQWDKSGYF